jgi:hypothetical protein
MLKACDFCVEIFLTKYEATLFASPSTKDFWPTELLVNKQSLFAPSFIPEYKQTVKTCFPNGFCTKRTSLYGGTNVTHTTAPALPVYQSHSGTRSMDQTQP